MLETIRSNPIFFWVTSVFLVGILINFASHYLLKYTDKWYSGWSGKRKLKLEQASEARKSEARKLVGQTNEIIHYGLKEFRFRLYTLAYAGCSIMFAFLSLFIVSVRSINRWQDLNGEIFSYILLFAGFLVLILMISSHRKSVYYRDILDIARSMENDEGKNKEPDKQVEPETEN